MRSRPLLSAALIFATSASAAYDKYFFSTEQGNWRCSDNLGFDCPPPQVCAYNALLQKHYCCGPGSGAVCWSGATGCDGGNDKTPSSSQLGCSSGEYAFCCLKDREECTQTSDQINICWATEENLFMGVPPKVLNQTFSSLSSAKPKATTLSFNGASLISSLSATSALSIDLPTTGEPGGNAPTTAAPSPSPSTSDSPNTDDSSSLSGGAIAGIVIGGVAGLALVGVAVFFLLRRRKAKQGHGGISEADAGNPYMDPNNPYQRNGEYMGVAQAPPAQEKYRHSMNMPPPGVGGGAVATEADNTAIPAEMPVNQQQPVEIDGNVVERR